MPYEEPALYSMNIVSSFTINEQQRDPGYLQQLVELKTKVVDTHEVL